MRSQPFTRFSRLTSLPLLHRSPSPSFQPSISPEIKLLLTSDNRPAPTLLTCTNSSLHLSFTDMSSNDPRWGYGKPIEGKGNALVICDFWNFLSKGRITRHKHHLVGDSPQIKKSEQIPRFDDAFVDINDKDEEATTNIDFFQWKSKRPMSSSSSTVNTKNPTKGPLDVMYPPSKITRTRKGELGWNL
ncbi:unnamed protein product [Lactuca saligna]|uniref:Uncharacterized protein n=1 Tax=Lactuca saligna TaxID=75948 RepID=A0AA35YP90_LACSI|nr:unnamed protein product [Lactuca saligna]